MYSLDFETLKKLVDIYNLMNQIEVKGLSNAQILFSSLSSLQQILQELNSQPQNMEQIKIPENKKGE
jgi:hypothetical protein